MTAVKQPVRVGDALERERLLDVEPEPALFDEFALAENSAAGGGYQRFAGMVSCRCQRCHRDISGLLSLCWECACLPELSAKESPPLV